MPPKEKKSKVVDFTTLDTKKQSEDGAVYRVLSPRDGTETGATIRLAGADSDTYRAIERKQNNKRTSKISSGRPFTLTQEEVEEDNLKKAMSCTLGWTDMILNGQELECTPENVRMMYERFPWLYEQVWVFIQDRKNFLS